MIDIKGEFDLPEADKVNLADLAAAIIEVQKENDMRRLSLDGISSKTDSELLPEEGRLIDALANSGFT